MNQEKLKLMFHHCALWLCMPVALVLASCGGGSGEDEEPQRKAPAGATEATPAVTALELFRFAELTWPELFPDSPPLAGVNHQGRTYQVRAYVNGNHLGVSDGRVYGLGPFTNGQLQDFGAVTAYAPQVCAATGCGTLESGAVFDAVTVGQPFTGPIKDGAFLHGSISTTTLRGDVTGDVTSLSNRTIHVIVEDPAKLFAEQASLTVTSLGSWPSYSLQLTPRPLEKVGHFTGTIKVLACLDARCDVRLKGTPISIPYDVKVSPSMLRTPRGKLEVTSTFGVAPGPVDLVTIDEPVWFEGWAATEIKPPENRQSGEYPLTSQEVRTVEFYDRISQRGTVRMDFRTAKPGTYRGVVSVGAYLAPPGRRTGVLDRQQVEVVYTVAPSSTAAVISPPTLEIPNEGPSNPPRAAAVGWTHAILSDAPLNYTLVGVERLAAPPGETDAELLNGWVTAQLSRPNLYVTTQVCRNVGSSIRCLKPGTYTAQVRVRASYYTGDPLPEPFDLLLPVRLTMQ